MTSMNPVESSNISHIGYDDAANELHVQFKDGPRWIYSGVAPTDHAAFVGAESIGKHFHAQVRGKFDGRRAA